jgi:hypothetical protein
VLMDKTLNIISTCRIEGHSNDLISSREEMFRHLFIDVTNIERVETFTSQVSTQMCYTKTFKQVVYNTTAFDPLRCCVG